MDMAWLTDLKYAQLHCLKSVCLWQQSLATLLADRIKHLSITGAMSESTMEAVHWASRHMQQIEACPAEPQRQHSMHSAPGVTPAAIAVTRGHRTVTTKIAYGDSG